MTVAEPENLSDADPAASNRVLLIESDAAVGRSLVMLLDAAGFSVERTMFAEDGVSFAASGSFPLVLLGPNPPQLRDGDLAASLRASRIDAPFRFLSVAPAELGGKTMHISPCP